MEAITEMKQGYKKTKVGWIPEEWTVVRLGEKGTLVNGLTYSPSDVVDDGILVLRSSNVQNGNIEFKDNVFVKEDGLKYNPVKEGDILICVRNGSKSLIGKNALINEKCGGMAFGAFMAVYRSDFNEYFTHLFKTGIYQREVYRNLGATINSINGSDLKKFIFPIPPLPEQRKIANILSTWNKAIKQNQKLIEQLKRRKKGLMQQLLTGKTRLKGFSGDWKEAKLEDVTNRITKKNEELNDNVVTISAQRGFVRQEDYFKKRVASDTLSGYYLIEKGNFAYNKSYSKGYPMGTFKRLDNLDKAVVTTLYICFSIKDTVDSDFMVNFFEGSLMVNNLMKIAQEGGRAHGLLNISLGDFFSLKLRLPSLEEQQAIAKVLTTSDTEIKAQETYLAQLQAQKKGLMQQLLTGQKRVKV